MPFELKPKIVATTYRLSSTTSKMLCLTVKANMNGGSKQNLYVRALNIKYNVFYIQMLQLFFSILLFIITTDLKSQIFPLKFIYISEGVLPIIKKRTCLLFLMDINYLQNNKTHTHKYSNVWTIKPIKLYLYIEEEKTGFWISLIVMKTNN